MNNGGATPHQSKSSHGCVAFFGILIVLAIVGGIFYILFFQSWIFDVFTPSRDYPRTGYYYYEPDYYYYQNGTWYIYDEYYGWLRTRPDSYLRDHYDTYYYGDAYDHGYGFYDGDYNNYGNYGDYYDDGYYDDYYGNSYEGYYN